MSSSGLKHFCVHFYHPPVILFERDTKYQNCHGAPSCVAIVWKGKNWKFIFLWRKINWHGLLIAKHHFGYTIWLMISEKSIMAYTFLHHGDQACTKRLSKQGIQKKLLDYYFQFLEHIYTYRKKEFQKILEKKLRN